MRKNRPTAPIRCTTMILHTKTPDGKAEGLEVSSSACGMYIIRLLWFWVGRSEKLTNISVINLIAALWANLELIQRSCKDFQPPCGSLPPGHNNLVSLILCHQWVQNIKQKTIHHL